MSSPPRGGAPPPTSRVPPGENMTNPSPPTKEIPSPAMLVFPPPVAGNGGAVYSSSPTLPRQGGSRTMLMTTLGVGIGIGGAVVLICVFIFFCCYRRKQRRHHSNGSGSSPLAGSKNDPQHHRQQNALSSDMAGMLPKPSPPPGSLSSSLQFSDGSYPPPLSSGTSSLSSDQPFQRSFPDYGVSSMTNTQWTFSYEELELATDHFSINNLLGQGGFGYVYKGLLPSGKEVAIKQLKSGSVQGEREFQAEVETISHVHHKHLVLLVGYCIAGDQRLLVYEFVPNKTLEFHLYGKDCPPINWASRMKIALGSAKGLSYLHEDCQPKVIHRDIKAANILLDDDFEAKVADFGLARFFYDTDTHISTRVVGTFGYLAPEYALTGKLTEKSDVFSFGVMLLELITGRRPIDKVQNYLDNNIVDWARPLLRQALEDDNFDSIADPRLEKDYNSAEMTRMVACAGVCVRHLARRRPRMSQIVRALEGNISLEDLNEGVSPGQSTQYSIGNLEYFENPRYKEDLQKFRKMVLENSSDSKGPHHQPSDSSNEQNSQCLPTTSMKDQTRCSETQTCQEMDQEINKDRTNCSEK